MVTREISLQKRLVDIKDSIRELNDTINNMLFDLNIELVPIEIRKKIIFHYYQIMSPLTDCFMEAELTTQNIKKIQIAGVNSRRHMIETDDVNICEMCNFWHKCKNASDLGFHTCDLFLADNEKIKNTLLNLNDGVSKRFLNHHGISIHFEG